MKDKFKVLIDEFPGDEKWDVFSTLFKGEERPDFINEFPGWDSSILSVILFKFGMKEELARNWMKNENEGLDGNTPQEVYQREDGVVILKAFLMRMP
jgi:hypothetical protein